jgi:hypothetical protein
MSIEKARLHVAMLAFPKSLHVICDDDVMIHSD